MNRRSDFNFWNCVGILTTFLSHLILPLFMIRSIIKNIFFLIFTLKCFCKSAEVGGKLKMKDELFRFFALFFILNTTNCQLWLWSFIVTPSSSSRKKYLKRRQNLNIFFINQTSKIFTSMYFFYHLCLQYGPIILHILNLWVNWDQINIFLSPF